ncbi:hypothetical protein FRC14_001771 [Serendipita sp. 396]|nr:hypothetical protein FRC14_001771 [Serendipita sp. 396]KAG8766523.1 hypothetical protein FRC16_007643 [Serendipita sp. 398]KAG8774177.1 hypothetical protein FRC15_001512 [Serendipita sp. 397]KAG8829318.1 hypothetical protein FRC18_009387 [Serendipita sp. 400]KAG8845668.1 hypothetical protein FRC20_003137 [Serendipita sp. 405]
MKHGVAFRKLSRPTAHRMLMLRNMVSSLIEHEQIQTTVAKAKEAARLAEKLITLGKKGNASHRSSALSFLMSPRLLPKVFDTLATRYKHRPGGYTRIYRYGHRPGDNAPKAVLELVDGPRDTKFEMLARRVGWEVKGWTEKGEHTKLYKGIEKGVESIEVLGGNAGFLSKETREDVTKILRFRPSDDRTTFGQKAAGYLNHLLVEDTAKASSKEQRQAKNREDIKQKKRLASVHHQDRQLWERVWDRAPGQVTAGSPTGSLHASKGLMTRARPWQLVKRVAPLQISAHKKYSPPKVIRVKTVRVKTDKKGKRSSTVVIEEGRSLKDMPWRQKALSPAMQSALSI